MLVIDGVGAAEQTISKSKFIAWASQCESEQAVAAFLRAIATQHQNASHLAYAFRVNTAEGIVLRFSDAGEPSGTAGKPILQMLEGRDLINICVGVIRYYGGVNLGKGGLARAYGSTARLALENTNMQPFVEMEELALNIHYNRMDELLKVLTKIKGRVLEKSFDEMVHVKISLPVIEKQALMNRFKARNAK
jgi:uncharacterized YigZ family protein